MVDVCLNVFDFHVENGRLCSVSDLQLFHAFLDHNHDLSVVLPISQVYLSQQLFSPDCNHRYIVQRLKEFYNSDIKCNPGFCRIISLWDES